MRGRAFVASVLILLPAALTAQRLPRMPGSSRPGPDRTEPLPPQPAVVARSVAFQRSRVSFESYPMVSYLQTPAVGTLRARRGLSVGGGTRMDYRVSRFVSLTADVTSSSVVSNGTATLELGTRIRPERTERRFYPFVDLRAGYLRAYEQLVRPGDLIDGGAPGTGARYSDGYGGVAGAGAEFALSRRFSLTAGSSILHGRMSAYDVRGAAPTSSSFPLTSYRFTLGLRYNPVRLITQLNSKQ